MVIIGLLVFLLGVYKISQANVEQPILWASVALLGVLVFAAGLTESDSRRAR